MGFAFVVKLCKEPKPILAVRPMGTRTTRVAAMIPRLHRRADWLS